MLIFILPSAFYIKLVKKESMKSVQKIGVRRLYVGQELLGNCSHVTHMPPALQATAFLLCGFVVMSGSMTLIILDWIHNATAGPATKPSEGVSERTP